MILQVYLGVLIYFILGAFVTLYISRKENAAEKRETYLKFAFYFLIVNIILLGTVANNLIFTGLAMIIVIVSLLEIVRLFYRQDVRRYRGFFLLSVLLFLIISGGFLLFSKLETELILYTYILVMVSDASSQHSGQLFGKHKIFGRISPKKTLEGVIGGIFMTLLSSILLYKLIEVTIIHSLFLGFSISFMANLGDLSASAYKRRFGAKDFSRIIPGHGGFLDRFDSFLMAGAFICLLTQLNFIP